MNLNAIGINSGLIREEIIVIALCKKWLEDNNILMYSTHNEGKSSVLAERFIKTLKDEMK